MDKVQKKQTKKEKESIRSEMVKIVINAGTGRASNLPNFSDKILPQISRDIALVSGQKPQTRGAKISIAGFKIRDGQIVGLKVTLRRQKMVDFFEKLIKIALPRVHDFRGISKNSVDESGALNIGLMEQFVFPEINAEESPFTFPLGINVVLKTKSRDKALEIYGSLGVPFKK